MGSPSMSFMNLTRSAITAISALLTVGMMTSCATAQGGYDQSTFDRVQVVEVYPEEDISRYASSGDVVPPSQVIQPEELVLSPVIDIATLREVESTTDNVRASSDLQEEEKTRIEEAIANGEQVDTTLSDDYEEESSGQLALEATEKSFVHVDHSTDFDNSIAVYDFIPNKIYEIITSPGKITDFQLKPGESISGTPFVTDSVNWRFTMGTSVEDGETIQHLFISPLQVGLDTTMIVLTNQRTYRFRMASFENQYMTGLLFRYPVQLSNGTYVSEDFSQYIADTSLAGAYTVDLTKVDYAYRVEVAKGRPTWTPVTVYSDDVRTYMQMPLTLANSDEMPSVYLVRGGDENLVNYRIIGNIYQIDNVLSDDSQYFLLKSGQDEQVRIYRNI